MAEDAEEGAYPLLLDQESTPVLRSDNGQLVWDRSNPEAGLITIDTPKTKVLLGYTAGEPVEFDGLKIEATDDERWQIIGLTAQDDKPLRKSEHMLLVASGNSENTDMGWTSEEKVSVADNWGEAPTLIEVIEARIHLKHPGQIRVWALDETGERAEPIAVQRDRDGFHVFSIGQDAPTLWYEIEAK